MSFVFKKLQRVFLPSQSGEMAKQAVIVTRKEFAWRENEYGLQALHDHSFDGEGCLVIEHFAIGEAVLIAAQPAPSNLKSAPRKWR